MIACGHGLHSGIKSGLILSPLPAGRGIVFANLTTAGTVPAHLDYVESTGYATTLHAAGMTVGTVEHLLATLHAYGITDLLIKAQSEVPTMDGSAKDFCALIEQAGVAVAPGIGFGPAGEGHVRLALIEAEARIQLAAERIQKFLRSPAASAPAERG